MGATTFSRKLATVGFVIAAGVLALGSIAYACTTYKGDMTFTANGVSQTVTGINGVGLQNMDWCTPDGADPPVNITLNNAVSNSVTISAAPASQCLVNGANKLATGTYHVAWVLGYMPGSPGTTQHINCHNEKAVNFLTSQTDPTKPMYQVDSGTAAARTFSFTPVDTNRPKGYVNMCVFSSPPVGDADANDINMKLV